jgi:hypothetical protein
MSSAVYSLLLALLALLGAILSGINIYSPMGNWDLRRVCVVFIL